MDRGLSSPPYHSHSWSSVSGLKAIMTESKQGTGDDPPVSA